MIPEIALVALGGGAGAAARFVVDGAVQKANRAGIPLGTLVVNATGSLLVGAVTGAALCGLLGEPGSTVATAGVLGGYTTFSTACVETARLARGGMRRPAVLHALGTLLVSLACFLAGFGVATAIW